MKKLRRILMSIAVAAAVFAVFAMVAVLFWRMWEAKKQPQITSTLVIYSSEPTPGDWTELGKDDSLMTYFDEEDIFVNSEKT